jgi:hypothetical protein
VAKRKRVLFLAGCVAAVLVASYLALRWAAPRHHINKEGFDAIRVGMSEQEVEAILGGPPGDYSATGAVPCPAAYASSGTLLDRGVEDLRSWVGDDAAINVAFDAGGLVVWKDQVPILMHTREALLDRVRSWLAR